MKSKPLWIALLVFSLLFAGCGPTAPKITPTSEADAVRTAAAQTAEAGLTELAQPTNTLPPPPTDTAQPPSPTVETTPVLPEQTTVVATPVAPAPGSERADFVAETIPDGTDFGPGESFTKIWTLKNTGSTIWTTAYALAFVSGAPMGAPESVPLTKNVVPGETVDISVNLTAPLESGTHRGYWKMRNAVGVTFEIAVWVEIDVVGGTPAAQATSPADAGVTVKEVTLSVDAASANQCPHTFTFTASFVLNKAATVTYRLEAGSDTPGFNFTLPGSVTASFDAGTRTVSVILTLTDSVNGWAQFHVISPKDVSSNQVTFTLTCK